MAAPWSTVSTCLPGDRRGWGEPHSQSPVNSDDEGDVVGGKAHGGEHDDHGDEPGLGDASCPDAGCGGCDAAGEGRQHCWALDPRRRPECQSLWGQHCGAGIIRNATAGHSWGRGTPLPKVLWSQRLYPWPQQNVLRSLWKALCLGLIPGLGRSPGGGRGNPLQYSCLGNPMDRGAWQAAVRVGFQKVVHGFPSSTGTGSPGSDLYPQAGMRGLPFHLCPHLAPSHSSSHTSSPSTVLSPAAGLCLPCACLKGAPCYACPCCRPSSGP